MQASSASCFVDYVLSPRDPILSTGAEYTIGAGASYTWLTVDGSVSALFGAAYGENPAVIHIKQRRIGGSIRGSFDYYFTRYFFMPARAEGRFIPRLDVPSVANVNPYNGETKTLRQHSIDFSGLEISLGVRFHF